MSIVNRFKSICENYETEIEQLKAENLELNKLINGSVLQHESCEFATLKSKLKIAKDALEEIAYSGSSREFCTRVCEQTLSEIGGEI